MAELEMPDAQDDRATGHSLEPDGLDLALQQAPNYAPLILTHGQRNYHAAQWQKALSDFRRCIQIDNTTTTAYFFAAKCCEKLKDFDEAVTYAESAHKLCTKTKDYLTMGAVVQLIVVCRQARNATDLTQNHNSLLIKLENLLRQECETQIQAIRRRVGEENGEARVGEDEEASTKAVVEKEIQDLRTAFAISDPTNLRPVQVPEFLIDSITTEIMHDPVVTLHGDSYERATIGRLLACRGRHPISRVRLTESDLRPNFALKKACNDFIESNRHWVS